MKILYVANAAQIGGGNKSLLSMAKKFQERYNTYIVVPGEGDFASLLREENLQFSILKPFFGKSSVFNFLLSFLQVLRIAVRFSPDIIHANDLFCYRVPSLVAKFLNIPIICHMRFSVDTASIKYFFRVRPSFVIFNSYYLKNLFLRNNPDFLDLENEVVYNFFNPDEYYFPDYRNIIRDKWKLNNYFIVAMIGNFYPVKGHEVLLHAVAKLKEYRKIKFLIIGKDLDPSKVNEKRLKNLVKNLNLENRVIFLGFQKNIGQVLAGVDVLVVPSIYEPFGRVAVEGLLGALPVVSSHTGGLVEIVEDAPYAFAFPPQNSKKLAELLYDLFKKPPKYPVLENRIYAIDKFGQDNNYLKLESIYRQLV